MQDARTMLFRRNLYPAPSAALIRQESNLLRKSPTESPKESLFLSPFERTSSLSGNCRGRIRTADLGVMSPAGYSSSPLYTGISGQVKRPEKPCPEFFSTPKRM